MSCLFSVRNVRCLRGVGGCIFNERVWNVVVWSLGGFGLVLTLFPACVREKVFCVTGVIIGGGTLGGGCTGCHLVAMLNFKVSTLDVLFLKLYVVGFGVVFTPLFVVAFLNNTVINCVVRNGTRTMGSNISNRTDVRGVVSELPGGCFNCGGLEVDFGKQRDRLSVIIINPAKIFVIRAGGVQNCVRNGCSDER